MELFAKMVNDSQPLNIFAKSSIFDDWLSSEYVSADCGLNTGIFFRMILLPEIILIIITSVMLTLL